MFVTSLKIILIYNILEDSEWLDVLKSDSLLVFCHPHLSANHRRLDFNLPNVPHRSHFLLIGLHSDTLA